MNLVQLKYFNAVCMFGNVSEAAKHLHISQPSLSSAVKELEKEFGVALFVRHHKGMTLTAEGEELRKMSMELICHAEQVASSMNDMGNERKRLRLGVPPMIGSIILPQLYREFLNRSGDVVLEISESGRKDLVKRMSQGLLDMAFLPHTKPPGSEFQAKYVARLEIVCCMTQDNPLAKEKFLTPQALANTPVVLFKDNYFQTEEIKKWFAGEKVTPDILLQTDQLSTMTTVVRSGVAAGFAFRQTARKTEGIVCVKMEPPVYVDVSIVSKKDSYPLSAVKKLLEFVSDSNLFENDK